MSPIRNEEAVAFRDFIKKVSASRLEELLRAGRPEALTAEAVLTNDSDAIARLSIMHTGYDSAVAQFFNLAESKPTVQSEPGFADMT
ncbi:MAG: hypothetical protein M0Q93_00210 [Terrimicrobiaceae bacterium]|nr:hypothetical protein [Terrimicrobiaceae bacterium]